ncbi:hypothetical protein PPYR_05640 [Photinus pyralis]|uniref:RNase H type-1 domain-containing protein n=1 Tax=Photinus pyralis TaxID=7054 RepID=A0A1Y1MUC8_PHOPY|nr:ribonuclease H1 [Photinus pyralis]KAB0801286.1 hypothetical protein PPYR_05640 [Photinus pyralis]
MKVFLLPIIVHNLYKVFRNNNPIAFIYLNIMTSRKRPSNSTSLQRSNITKLIDRLQMVENTIQFAVAEIGDIKKELLLLQDGSTTCDGVSETALTGAKRSCYNFSRENEFVVVYTDGACENNGRANAKAGIGVWFGHNHPLNISCPVKGRPTNNTAEIQACIHAIKTAHANGIRKLKIKTDSEFVINSMTKWILKWRTNNWKVAGGGDVKNKEDFVILDKEIKLLDQVVWEHVDGHVGIEGNEAADRLAKAGANLYKP